MATGEKLDPAELPEAGQDSPYPDGVPALAFADGASRGNPGAASWGVAYCLPDGTPLCREGCAIGEATNNVAEWKGLVAAMERLIGWGVPEAIVRMDSQLVVRQLSGQYKVKNAGLKPFHEKAVLLRSRFARLRVEHVPRKENALADAVANMALDRA